MNLDNAGWTGRLGSAYQLPGYLGMAEWTPEVRTPLKLSSCKCSVCGRKAASLVVHFISKSFFHSPLPFPRKDTELPLGLSDLLFSG